MSYGGWGLAGLNGAAAAPYGQRNPAVVAATVAAADSPVTGMRLWLDADDSATVTLSGANVTGWNDKSGNGYNFTSSSNPTVGSINGLDAITFPTWNGTGLTSTATLANIFSASAYTFFSVFKTSAIDAGAGSYNGLISDSAGHVTICVNDATTPDFMVRNNDGVVDAAIVDISDVETTGVICIAQHTGGNIRVARGASDWAATTASGDTAGLTGTLRVAQGTGGSPWFHGSIGEIIVYNTALSAADISSNVTYLTEKWGL